MKRPYIAAGVVVVLIVALKLHVPLKLLILPSAVALFYLCFPFLHRYYQNSTLQYTATYGTAGFGYPPRLLKLLLTVAGAVLTLFIAVKLRINIKLLIIPLAAVLAYLYLPELSRYYRNDMPRYAEGQRLSRFHYSPSMAKIASVAAGIVLAYFIAIRLHINVKWLVFPLAAAILYFYFPVWYHFYQNSALRDDDSAADADYRPIATKTLYMALAVITAFIIAFKLHLKFLMYPLAAAIFYFYVPLLYLFAKKSALQYAQSDSPAKLVSYLWFSAWFLVACFFSYMLSHLLADVITSFHWSFFRYLLYVFILLMAGGLGIIVYLQWTSKKIDALGDMHINFETQGRLASFEILLSLLIVFLVKH